MDEDTARNGVRTETSPKKTSSAVKHVLDPSPPKKKQLINFEHAPKDLKAPSKKPGFTPATPATPSTKPARRFAKKSDPVDQERLLFDNVDGASTDSSAHHTPHAQISDHDSIPSFRRSEHGGRESARDELLSDVATEDLDEVMVEDHVEGNGVRKAQVGDTVHILWRLCMLDGTTIRKETRERVRSTLCSREPYLD